MKRVLITGGCGNLGRLLAQRFEARGIGVVSFDLPGSAGPRDADRLDVVEGDVCDTAKLASVIDAHGPDAIVHLASLLSGSSEADPERAWKVNATASFELMRLAADRVPGPFVFASTIATYGPDAPMHLPLDAPQWPANVYGATKVAVERLGVWMKQTRDFDFRCLRFPMVLSPYAPAGALTAYPGHAALAAARGAPFVFPVGADSGMSTLYLDDVTRSLEEIALATRETLRHPAYNLHAFRFTAGELAEAIRDAFPGADLSFAPSPGADALIKGAPDTMDSSAAEADWGWRPAYDFEASVRALIALVREG